MSPGVSLLEVATKGIIMTDKNPVFRVVKDADAEMQKDLPHLELITNSDSPKIKTVKNSAVSPKQSVTFSAKESTNLTKEAGHVQAPDVQPSIIMQPVGESTFAGYPPLPAMVIGLFLLVFMLLGD